MGGVVRDPNVSHSIYILSLREQQLCKEGSREACIRAVEKKPVPLSGSVMVGDDRE